MLLHTKLMYREHLQSYSICQIDLYGRCFKALTFVQSLSLTTNNCMMLFLPITMKTVTNAKTGPVFEFRIAFLNGLCVCCPERFLKE